MSWKSIVVLASAATFATAAWGGTALAQDRNQNLAAAEPQAAQLLLLMDKDQNGKVSRQEFMSFMAAEFDRLDKDKDGELNVSELNQAQIRGFSNKKPGGR
ncbi:MAG: hypothetical protein ACLQJR_23830 [Stellaceae bacterium]